MASFVDIVMGGSEKVRNYSDVIYGWSPDMVVNKDSTNKPPLSAKPLCRIESSSLHALFET